MAHIAIRTWPAGIPDWAAVWPVLLGRYNTAGRTKEREIRHFFCIHLVSNGKIRLRIADNPEVTLSYGDMFAIWPEVPFAYYPDPEPSDEEIELWYLRLTGPLTGPLIRQMGLDGPRYRRKAIDPEALTRQLSKLYEMAGSRSGRDDFLAVSLIHDLVPACRPFPEREEPSLSLAERVKQFMKDELDQGYNIDQLSQIFHVSRSKLFLDFKQAFNKSPIEVLIELRISRACDLLTNTCRSIQEIANTCGYRDPLYFTRQFTSMKGVPPGQFRKTATPS